MKNLSALSLTALAFLAVMVAPAAARDIACPRDQVRTEITTDLPDPWWQTPQVGSLESTRVGAVGGETTLICEYFAYGTTVSVMRRPPNRFPNCTATRSGFDCRRERGGRGPGRPAEVESVTYRTGPLSVPQTWSADFDNGTVGGDGADVWFRAVTARERYVEPRNGAQIGIYSGGGGISKGDCMATPKSGNRIPISDLPVGTYVCVLTDEGRHAVFRVNEAVGASPGTLEIGFTTWE